MDEFDDIRPYRDDEVGPAVAALADDPAFVAFGARFAVPALGPGLRTLLHPLIRRLIKRQARRLDSVDDLQQLVGRYLRLLLRVTSDGMTVRGLDVLDPSQPYLFISNHRDIVLDPTLLNYALWLEGHATTQVAIGDNLLGTGYRCDLMRLNKAFVVYRDVSGAKAALSAMRQTSSYMRTVLEAGESVWIAQRQGRSKDGVDRTEPALLKMLHLAYRSETRSVGEWLRRVRLAPVSISYEIDPCAPIKARELYYRDTQGRYDKDPEEDAESIERGIAGFKGRIHVHVSPPVEGDYADADELARHLDHRIVSNLVDYPTHHHARSGGDGDLSGASPRTRETFLGDLAACPDEYRPYFLLQYANQVEHKRTLETAKANAAPVGRCGDRNAAPTARPFVRRPT